MTFGDTRTVDERFWQQVEVSSDGCWLWTGAPRNDGYAYFKVEYRFVRAHRWAYQRFVGPVPKGLVLDHLCEVRACVNPTHLEAVTQKENIRRCLAHRAKANAAKGYCKNGHEFTPENTRVKSNGWRQCRACHRHEERQRRMRALS